MINVIFGPPGTGKTTDLLNTVDLLLNDGVPPERIGFIAFTRKAANEARDRAVERFNMTPDRFPWFRTLHSFAFNRMGYGRNNVMGMNDYLKICQVLGLCITFKTTGEDGTFNGQTKGDRLFFAENMARATKVPLRQYWEEHPDEDIYWYELERLSTVLSDYKRENDKVDFTDIIMKFNQAGDEVMPDLHTLIVDEAQDLTPLQWEMVHKLVGNVEEVYIAGDDDQAIFRWAGADVEHLIKLDGHRRILTKSYRVPSKIQEKASEVAARISSRVEKVWEPRELGGEVHYHTSIEHIDMSEGSWLLLGRNVYLLDQFVEHCSREGFIFDCITGSPIRGASFRAIKHWEELRQGQRIRMAEVVNIYDHMSTKVGVVHGFKRRVEEANPNMTVSIDELRDNWGLATDAIWHQALDKLAPHEVEYFIAAMKRGERLLREPRIKINTIHGVKGGEADNVVILTDMAERTYREYQQFPDDEHRVWYVAITRARNNLFIIQPSTNRNYTL